VSATPLLQVDANLVAFQYQTNGATPAPQNLSVSATSGALGFYPTVQTSDGGSWLTVTPTYATTPTTATVSVNPTGLTAGSYLGLIAFNVADGSTPAYFVTVSLQISDGPILTVPSQFLAFSATTGGSITAVQTISVSSTGPPSMVQMTTPGTNWLQVNPTSAMTNVSLSVQASPASLSPGYYTGVVGIQIPGIQNSQQNVPVVFMVNPPTVNPGP
jgi:Viral BACON domain